MNNFSLINKKTEFTTINNEPLFITRLSQDFAKKNYREILSLINIIPLINWTKNELFKDYQPYSKWATSLAIIDRNNKVISVLISYFRLADNKHIFDSLYIHKLAVLPEYQNKGIGTSLLTFFSQQAFLRIKWLMNISVQTNLNEQNKNVLSFYKKSHFQHQYKVFYPDKTDSLLLLTKESFLKYNNLNNDSDTNTILQHPRVTFDRDLFDSFYNIPKIYFSTSNKRKRELYKFIFNNFNIEVTFVKPKSNLIEPQTTNSILDERNLITHPLKQESRFIDKTPFVIEDTMLFLEYFNRDFNYPELPGHDTKRWWNQLSNEGILKILGNTNKRKAKFVSQVGAYLGKGNYIYGRGETFGTISFEKRLNNKLIGKTGAYPYFFHSIFIPNGSEKTLSEMDIDEYSKFDYKRKSIIDFISKLKHSYFFGSSINRTLFE